MRRRFETDLPARRGVDVTRRWRWRSGAGRYPLLLWLRANAVDGSAAPSSTVHGRRG